MAPADAAGLSDSAKVVVELAVGRSREEEEEEEGRKRKKQILHNVKGGKPRVEQPLPAYYVCSISLLSLLFCTTLLSSARFCLQKVAGAREFSNSSRADRERRGDAFWTEVILQKAS